jgi:arylsulfatase A-like enzyme
MRPASGLLVAVLAIAASGCNRFQGPLYLLKERSTPLPRTGTVAAGGESRPALLAPARYDLPLPRRGLLTFGAGIEQTGAAEIPGWFQVQVRSGETTLFDKRLNPRELRGWRDVSVPLADLGRRAPLEFDLRLVEKDGRDVAPPPGVVLALSDPVVHDLDDYGRAKGVVLISIDTLRRDHVGAYGYPKPTTPRLDALARGGLVCDDAVSVSSWTLPAHLSMLTSTDPGVHGGIDMNVGYNRKPPTLATMMRAAGFTTRAVTSHLYVSGVYGLDVGFDHLEYNQYHRAPEVAGRAIDLLDRFGDRPFFVFLHFYDPHWHYDPHETTTKLFEAEYRGTLSGKWGDFKDLDPAKVAPADMAHMLALYDGEIRFTDDEVGRVLDHLRARGLDRSTLVVVTSDHGEEFGEHGSWEHQKTLYEEVLRIPLIVNGPGVASRREMAPVSLLDVAPTVLAWAGVSPQWQPQGHDLLAALPPREAPYGETDRTIDGTRKLFVRDGAGRGKVIVSLEREGAHVVRDEWYDLATDPAERQSRPPASEIAEKRRREAIARWRAGRDGGRGAPKVTLTEEQRERLRANGYF